MPEAKIHDVEFAYDRVANEYARRIYDELRNKPLDRALLDRFAARIPNSEGVVCDLGCGPGQVARYLKERGVHVCGMDLSEGMLSHARKLNPDIVFERGDMRVLPAKDNSWAGIAAFYSIVNLAPQDVAQALGEMMRVLVPGGRLLLSFHVGEDSLHVEEDLWGCGVALETTLFRVSTIEYYIRKAGFCVEEIIERGPYTPDVEYQSRRAYILAHKPVSKMTRE
jgi:ubiquinone/menaquinone biosynthesis C-methylase UbiE